MTLHSPGVSLGQLRRISETQGALSKWDAFIRSERMVSDLTIPEILEMLTPEMDSATSDGLRGEILRRKGF